MTGNHYMMIADRILEEIVAGSRCFHHYLCPAKITLILVFVQLCIYCEMSAQVAAYFCQCDSAFRQFAVDGYTDA